MEELEDTQAQLEHWKRTVTQLEEEARRREEQLSVATENLTAVQARANILFISQNIVY
jgi:hypothetical protein